MSSVTVGLTRMARVGMKRPRMSSTRDRSSRAVGAEKRLTPPASSRRASTMRTLGQGRTEKVAACGALQCRRGEAPKAAFKLSPTFAADNGQRANPHAASARIDRDGAAPRHGSAHALNVSFHATANDRTRRQLLMTCELHFKPKMPGNFNGYNWRRREDGAGRMWTIERHWRRSLRRPQFPCSPTPDRAQLAIPPQRRRITIAASWAMPGASGSAAKNGGERADGLRSIRTAPLIRC